MGLFKLWFSTKLNFDVSKIVETDTLDDAIKMADEYIEEREDLGLALKSVDNVFFGKQGHLERPKGEDRRKESVRDTRNKMARDNYRRKW